MLHNKDIMLRRIGGLNETSIERHIHTTIKAIKAITMLY